MDVEWIEHVSIQPNPATVILNPHPGSQTEVSSIARLVYMGVLSPLIFVSFQEEGKGAWPQPFNH